MDEYTTTDQTFSAANMPMYRIRDLKSRYSASYREWKNLYGCNIRNVAYTPSNCAERTAFLKRSIEGERHLQKICIVNEDTKGIILGHPAMRSVRTGDAGVRRS